MTVSHQRWKWEALDAEPQELQQCSNTVFVRRTRSISNFWEEIVLLLAVLVDFD